jgi:hypothetical protein
MSTNCLNTELKEKSTNTSLPFLGKLRIGIPYSATPNAAYRRIRLIFTQGGQNAKLVGDTHFSDSALTADNGQSITVAPDVYAITSYVNGGAGTLITNKYVIMEINNKFEQNIDYNTVLSFYSEDFAFSTGLKVLTIPGAPIHGTLNEFANCPLENVDWKYCTFDTGASGAFVSELTTLKTFNVEGVDEGKLKINIARFANSIGLTSLISKYRGVVVGKIEDLCEGMVANGRTSGTLTIIGGAVTLNGVTDGSSATYIVAFSGSGCTVTASSSSRTATYDGTDWTYSS